VTIKAVQEQHTIVVTQKTEINNLKIQLVMKATQIDTHTTKIDSLETQIALKSTQIDSLELQLSQVLQRLAAAGIAERFLAFF
jgi:uncharacterized protein (DUF3084 family)